MDVDNEDRAKMLDLKLSKVQSGRVLSTITEQFETKQTMIMQSDAKEESRQVRALYVKLRLYSESS